MDTEKLIEEEVIIVPELRLENWVDTERQIVVHCHFKSSWNTNLIRIWPTTYLVCHQTGKEAKLRHMENITLAPTWLHIPSGLDYVFTLFFEGLPKVCKSFSLEEQVAEEGGFYKAGILRNIQDIYNIRII